MPLAAMPLSALAPQLAPQAQARAHPSRKTPRWRWKQWRRNAPRFTLCVGPRYISKLALRSDKDAMVCVMVEKLVVVVVDYDVY